MQDMPDRRGAGPRGVTRRQMIAGTGIAAAAWVAPSVVHYDVASAQGSGPGAMVTITPGLVPPGVTVFPNVTDTAAGTAVFGQFGRGDGNASNPVDNGPTFTLSLSGIPAHTTISGTVVICYEGDWESGGNGGDTMDIRIGDVGALPESAPGFPTSNVGIDAPSCISYPVGPIPHTATGFDVVIEGTVTAIPEDFGVASVMLEFT